MDSDKRPSEYETLEVTFRATDDGRMVGTSGSASGLELSDFLEMQAEQTSGWSRFTEISARFDRVHAPYFETLLLDWCDYHAPQLRHQWEPQKVADRCVNGLFEVFEATIDWQEAEPGQLTHGSPEWEEQLVAAVRQLGQMERPRRVVRSVGGEALAAIWLDGGRDLDNDELSGLIAVYMLCGIVSLGEYREPLLKMVENALRARIELT